MGMKREPEFFAAYRTPGSNKKDSMECGLSRCGLASDPAPSSSILRTTRMLCPTQSERQAVRKQSTAVADKSTPERLGKMEMSVCWSRLLVKKRTQETHCTQSDSHKLKTSTVWTRVDSHGRGCLLSSSPEAPGHNEHDWITVHKSLLNWILLSRSVSDVLRNCNS
eukprot:1841434-Amphidinium_carterae.1